MVRRPGPLLRPGRGVSLRLFPGWNTTTTTNHDDNRLDFRLGAGAAENSELGHVAI
ncbi:MULTISPECIES: hypothetical protein [unclassified Cryobacterium]|uniref:hypothetical protein n=1 Tax=unclassified Cryobacterium TaxID=2649013 RepID=UPI0018E07B39|nr:MULTISPECIES: hypothetical protein [unclassified Cryobacterium]MDY7527241.1 hypothetical protein [Cryobacterium sp. 10C2]MDY7556973.1 hypothetical protein [Cryobacterium sp. 10C3]MEB0002976.1 hypothetical protein [Cryobacterium sp. RTC2.1]MEB0201313.1 hypothetical protein [Cryobacterium sp. 5I3]MEB0285890.1 hypothetical protein [Cryobacterium sp. 10S3]